MPLADRSELGEPGEPLDAQLCDRVDGAPDRRRLAELDGDRVVAEEAQAGGKARERRRRLACAVLSREQHAAAVPRNHRGMDGFDARSGQRGDEDLLPRPQAMPGRDPVGCDPPGRNARLLVESHVELGPEVPHLSPAGRIDEPLGVVGVNRTLLCASLRADPGLAGIPHIEHHVGRAVGRSEEGCRQIRPVRLPDAADRHTAASDVEQACRHSHPPESSARSNKTSAVSTRRIV